MFQRSTPSFLFLGRIVIDSDNADYHYNYAALVLQQGNTQLARKHLRQALSINPANESVRQALDQLGSTNIERINILYRQGSFPEKLRAPGNAVYNGAYGT